MAKSKSTREFNYDGKKVKFNQAAFEHTVNEKAKEIQRKNGATRGGLVAVFRMIAQKLFCEDLSVVDDAIPLIKNWYYRRNGPDQIETILDLADALECETCSAFLTEVKEKKEDNNKMERTTAEQLQVSINQNAIIEAMRKAREKEEAYRLYSAFAESMEQFLKADIDVWFEYEEGTPEWKAAMAAFPKRLPLKCAIQKAKMFVSNDTIIKAENLLDEMFGCAIDESDEPSDIADSQGLSLSGYFSQRMDQYDDYLNQNGITVEEGAALRNDDWNRFIWELNNSWWGKLDEAFEEYIPERVYVFD